MSEETNINPEENTQAENPQAETEAQPAGQSQASVKLTPDEALQVLIEATEFAQGKGLYTIPQSALLHSAILTLAPQRYTQATQQ